MGGTARRKKKVVHRTATTDDKKLQSSLKKLSVNNIPGIEEVNMIKDDGSVIHFNNPKVQASLEAPDLVRSPGPAMTMTMRFPTLLRTLMRPARTRRLQRAPQRKRKFQKKRRQRKSRSEWSHTTQNTSHLAIMNNSLYISYISSKKSHSSVACRAECMPVISVNHIYHLCFLQIMN